MMYLYYLAILVILLAGVKFAGKGWNDEFLSLSSTKAVQGIFAILIMFHHMSQELPDCEELQYFEYWGILFVGIFFFCSGYGLIKSMHTKENYLHGFLKKRLLTILVPFYIINLLYFAVIGHDVFAGLTGGVLAKEIFLYIIGIKMINGNAWYIVAIAIFYVLFYIFFRYFKEKTAFLLMFISIVIYNCLGLYLNHNTCQFWLQGEWWYNTTALFFIGMLFCNYENQVIAFMKKSYYILLPVSLVLYYFVYEKSVDVLEVNDGYWCEFTGGFTRSDIFLQRANCLGWQVAAIILFVLVVWLITMKLKFQNPVLKFLGNIGLEIYLIHDAFMQLYHSELITIQNSIVYVGAVLCSTIVLSYILWRLTTRLNSYILKKC